MVNTVQADHWPRQNSLVRKWMGGQDGLVCWLSYDVGLYSAVVKAADWTAYEIEMMFIIDYRSSDLKWKLHFTSGCSRSCHSLYRYFEVTLNQRCSSVCSIATYAPWAVSFILTFSLSLFVFKQHHIEGAILSYLSGAQCCRVASWPRQVSNTVWRQ